MISGISKPNSQAADNTLKGPPSAVKTSFEAVAAKLDSNGHLYAYLSTEQALSKVNETLEGLVNIARDGVGNGLMDNPFIAPIVEGVLGVIEPAFQQSGISEINGLGMSSLAIEKHLWRSKMFMHHLPDSGTGLIWNAFGEELHTMDVLSIAPDNTASILHVDLEVKRVIEWADDVFGEMLGGRSILDDAPDEVRDIIDSFGNEAGFLMTLDAENKMVLPGFMFNQEDDIELDSIAFAILVRVNDGTLMEILGDTLGGGFGPPPGNEVGGVTIHSIPLPMPLPFKMDLNPCYFQVGDFMVLSSSEILAKRMAKAHEGDRRLEDDPGFKSLTKGIDLKANGIAYASPQANKWGLEMNELSYMGEPEASLEKIYDIYKESMEKNEFGMVSLFKVQEDGLLIESNSTLNTFGGYIVHSIVGIGIAVASSLSDLQESGLFEDLGVGGPPTPDFNDEPESGKILDLDLPVNP
ncbi:MAG: hypothetical protein VX392_00400 [Verrucomicrobiota bacterium]|nr:hypothetical protein [Verrucomicrobiota bacterium]